MLKDVLDQSCDLQSFLFIRGFLISDKEICNMQEFPFYGNWKKEKHGKFWFMAHKLTGMHIYEADNRVFFLMGHAYNPFTMEHEELEILRRISQNYGKRSFVDCLNELTGVYLLGVEMESITFF